MAGIRFDLSSPETIERFRQFVIETLGSAGELTPELQKKLEEKAQEIDVHKVDYEQAIWEVSSQIVRNKNQCPICGKGFHAAIPSFCEQCGWDLKNDLILGKNQKPFCLSDVNDYKKRIETAKRQWKEKLATIKQQKEIEDGKKRIQADKEALIRQKELEEAFLEKCKKSKDPIDCYNEYLLKYPEGIYKPHAKRAINEIEDKRKVVEIEEGRKKLDAINMQKGLEEENKRIQIVTQNIERQVKRDDSRFVFSDLAVLDNKTKLIWTRNGDIASKRMGWNDAIQFIEQLNRQQYAGYSDWRLPTKHELETLLKFAESQGYVKKSGNNINELFNNIGFRNVRPHNYWSATTYNNDSWYVHMCSGSIYYHYWGSDYCVWPVRSGQWVFLSWIMTKVVGN